MNTTLNKTNPNWFEVMWRLTNDLEGGITLQAHDLVSYLLGGIDGGSRDGFQNDDPRKLAGGQKSEPLFNAPPPVRISANEAVRNFDAGAEAHASQSASRETDRVAQVSFGSLAAIYDSIAGSFLRNGTFLEISDYSGQMLEGEFVFTPGDLTQLRPTDFSLRMFNAPQYAQVEPLLVRFAEIYAERMVFNCSTLNKFPPDKRALAVEVIIRMLRGRVVIDPCQE